MIKIKRIIFKKLKIYLLLFGVSVGTNAANISYIPKTTTGNSDSGKRWPNERFVPISEGECIVDKLTGLMWSASATKSKNITSITQANNEIPQILCGYSDWRLPTIIELRSLHNYVMDGGTWLASQGFKLRDFTSWFCSSSVSRDEPTNPRIVSGADSGIVKRLSQLTTTQTLRVLPVRGGR